MKRFLLITVLLLVGIAAVAQTPVVVKNADNPDGLTMAAKTADNPEGSTLTRRVIPAAPVVVKLPPKLSATLKQIQDRQDQLYRDFQALEAQKTIVAQRAALELNLTAAQVDEMELAVDDGVYVFKPKPPTQTPPKKVN